MSHRSFASRFWPVAAVSAVTAVVACSANSTNSTSSNGTGGVGASGSSGSMATNSSSGDIGFGANGNGGSGTGMGGSNACAAEPHQAMQLPLDIYIMLDQSGSMSDTVAGGDTKWNAVTGALQTFIEQPLSGISVGIQYFALTPSAQPSCPSSCNSDADCGNYGPCDPSFGCISCTFGATDSCDPGDYAKAEVEIAPLPGAVASLIASIQQHGPLTSTPTWAALSGAIDHAKAWQASHAGHVTVAVLATDGVPTECTVEDASGIAQVAAAGNTAGVKSFIIGVFAPADMPQGPDLLDQVAAAGGTGKAFNISTTQDVGQQFLDALNMIRGAALGCQYNIPVPEAGMADYGRVNVQYTPGGGGSPVVFDHYMDKAQCPASGDGWYYDDNTNPTQIILCDGTCDKVSGDSMGKIEILLGCKTKEPA